MVRFHSLLCFFAIILAYFATNSVGRETIVGGIRVRGHKSAYQVSLQYQDYGHECGGGIIGETFILTAAHCVVKKSGEIEDSRMYIVAGTNDLDDIKKPAVRVTVKKIFVPRLFQASHVGGIGDIAVLMLTESLQLSSRANLKPLRLSQDEHFTFNGETAEIAGFGWYWIQIKDNVLYDSLSDNHLRIAEAHVFNHCQHSELNISIPEQVLCAKVKQNNIMKPRGVCVGDSGGPLVINGTVIGVLSIGPKTCSEKEAGSLYTRVSHYASFITNAMQNKRHKDTRALELLH